MKIIYKKPSELKPYEKNAKEHSADQIEKVAASIKAFGFLQPIVIDSSNVVIVGHCRLEASKILKLPEIPCLIAEQLSPDQIKAYRLADNKLNESAWNLALVESDLKELTSELQEITGFDLSDFVINISTEQKEPKNTDFFSVFFKVPYREFEKIKPEFLSFCDKHGITPDIS